jgi:ElaB/YqjD/DUF883 family membrane-anchored ribosome-binding protein
MKSKWPWLLFCGLMHTAAYAVDDASKQVQMLNTQIQSQLQQIQENQKNVDKNLNAEIQGQLKKMQSDLQKQIDDGYYKTQNQIKAVQDALQQQIMQVNDNIKGMNAAKGK